MRGRQVNMWILAVLLLVATAARGESIAISPSTSDVSLTPHMEFLDDPTGALTIQDVVARNFHKDRRQVPVFAINRVVRWARIDLDNVSAATLERWISFSQIYYRSFSLFIPRGDGAFEERRSDIGKPRDADLDRPNLVYRLNLPPGRTTLYVRIDNILINFAASLRTDTAEADADLFYLTLQISTLAVLAVLILMLAGLAVLSRETGFLPVIAWAALILASDLSRFGLWRYLLGDRLGSFGVYYGFEGLTIIAALWFIRRFLLVDRVSPWAVKPIVALQIVAFATLPWRWIDPISESWILLGVSFVGHVGFFAILFGWVGDRRRGLIFCISVLPSLIAASLATLYFAGFMPLSPWMSDLGAVFQVMSMVILAMAVAREIEADMRSRRHAIDVSEAMARSRNDFLATISHEIRTPMTGILGMTELILARKLDSETRRDALLVQQSANALRNVINEVLDLSSLEQRRVELHKSAVDIRELVDGVATLFRAGALEKGVALEVIDEGTLPRWIEADPGRLRQVVLNVIANAVKFTREGRVTVRLSGARASIPGHVVIRIAVEDTGIGIAPEALPRLFKRFSQADQSIARQFGGTGLGLAIAKELIDLFGGDILVESRPGKGSIFTIVFEAAEAAEPARRAPREEIALPRLVPRNLRVLIAEDNEVNRLYVSSLLRGDGHSVDVVENGAEAVARVKAERYDLVLMDLQMPVLDGIAAAQAIRNLPLPANVVPIIALTANASAADREAALAAGMNEHLAKPFNMAELSAAIRRATG